MFSVHDYTNAVANGKNRTFEIHCGPLSHTLEQLGIRHVDFWSLDVEWSEFSVLKTVDLGAVHIDVIISESANKLKGK